MALCKCIQFCHPPAHSVFWMNPLANDKEGNASERERWRIQEGWGGLSCELEHHHSRGKGWCVVHVEFAERRRLLHTPVLMREAGSSLYMSASRPISLVLLISVSIISSLPVLSDAPPGLATSTCWLVGWLAARVASSLLCWFPSQQVPDPKGNSIRSSVIFLCSLSF